MRVKSSKLIQEREGNLELLRKKELRQIHLALQQQEYVLISASPKSGLSTLFSQIVDYIEQQEELTGYLPILIEAAQIEEPFFVSLALEIADRALGPIKNPQSRKRRFQNKPLQELFRSAFGKSEYCVVFIIDHFHALPMEKQQRLVRYMRQLHSSSHNSPYLKRILFLLGGTLRWQNIDPQKVSPFSNAASKLSLNDFDLEETKLWASHFFNHHHCHISKIASEYIFEVTQGHCYLTFALCKTLLRSAPREITFKQIDQAVHDLLLEGDLHLQSFRDRLLQLSAEETQVLQALLQGAVLRRSKFAPNPHLENLILLGVVTCDRHNHIKLRNSLYTKLIRRDKLLLKTLGVATIAHDEILCDHIVAANKEAYCMVNRIENELRNFLVSKLYQHFQENWLSQGLGCIQTDPERDGNSCTRELDEVLQLRQKKELRDISLPYTEDPIIGYATLKELETIVVKHWKNIFKAIVVSQDRFKVYLTILNRIRNKLAHNRRVTDEDIAKLKEIEQSFKGWMGGPL